LLAAALFVGVSFGQSAANETSDKILALSDDQRNDFWTLYLQQSGRQCDTAMRSMFQGDADGSEDVWSVACRDGSAYSVGIAPGPEGTTTLMSCDDATATETVLLRLSGSKTSGIRCWNLISH